MPRTFILPYNQFSQSAIKLSEEMGIRRIKLINSQYKYREGDTVINWGCSRITNPEVLKAKIINKPALVGQATNKITAFQNASNTLVRTVPYTQSYYTAISWLREEKTVVARDIVDGHSGKGITIVTPEDIHALPPNCPLYTLYQKKTDEFRIHFVGDRIIKVARKGRRHDVLGENVNWQVRNFDNGFCYALWDLENLPQDVVQEAYQFILGTGLDFGAIDIIYHKPTDKAYFLEVNTAPGLSGSTISAYAESLKKYV